MVVVGVGDSTYRDYAERGVFVTADGASVTDARTLASQLGLLRAMATNDLHRVVTFHSRIESARAFSTTIQDVLEWLPENRRPTGRLHAAHVSGRMSSGERDRRLNQLRAVGPGERGLLSNARCLAEGVDVPTLDGVAFIEPRRSQIDIVQAVGRAIRKAPDKTIGTVVIPVFVDETSDPVSAIEASAFDRVWQVLKALRAHDEVLAEELDELRRELGRQRTSVGRPSKIKLDLPVTVERASRAHSTSASSPKRRRPGSSGSDSCNGSLSAKDTRVSPPPTSRTATGSGSGSAFSAVLTGQGGFPLSALCASRRCLDGLGTPETLTGKKASLSLSASWLATVMRASRTSTSRAAIGSDSGW